MRPDGLPQFPGADTAGPGQREAERPTPGDIRL